MKIVEEYEKICLVEKKPDNTAGELKDAFSGRKICVCDFYIANSEQGEITERGYLGSYRKIEIDTGKRIFDGGLCRENRG